MDDQHAFEGPEVIPSLCVACGEEGETRILPTDIPYFHKISIESFYCEHCGYKNTTARDMNPIQPRGIKIIFTANDPKDMQRTMILSDTSQVEAAVEGRIILSREIHESQYTNVEGLFMSSIAGIGTLLVQETDDNRRTIYMNMVEDLQKIVGNESFPVTITIEDPSGNSFIETDPQTDSLQGKYRRTEFDRTSEQNTKLGLVDTAALETSTNQTNNESTENKSSNEKDSNEPEEFESSLAKGEIYVLQIQCPGCGREAENKMRQIDIPGFQDCTVSGVHCEHCGYRTSDVSVGGDTPDKGRKITLQVENPTDLQRDVLVSGFAVLEAPYVPLVVNPGSFSGRFTTVEGLLTRCKEQLSTQMFDAGTGNMRGGDSVTQEEKDKWDKIFKNLDSCINGEVKFEIIITDPMAKSYIQAVTDDDTQLQKEDYERSEEENEELGLNDMNVEGYEQEEA